MKKINHYKQYGFSLAEVLLTITIIGSIASFTIPAMLQNVQDSILKIAWKSAYSDVSQATNRILLDNGGTLKGVFSSYSDMLNKYSNYMISAKICDTDYSCWHPANEWWWMDKTPVAWGSDTALILNNGIRMFFELDSSDCGNISYSGALVPVCGFIYADVNGPKRPNTIGKDILLLWITKDRVLPGGTVGDVYENSCEDSPSGIGCAALYLRQ